MHKREEFISEREKESNTMSDIKREGLSYRRIS